MDSTGIERVQQNRRSGGEQRQRQREASQSSVCLCHVPFWVSQWSIVFNLCSTHILCSWAFSHNLFWHWTRRENTGGDRECYYYAMQLNEHLTMGAGCRVQEGRQQDVCIGWGVCGVCGVQRQLQIFLMRNGTTFLAQKGVAKMFSEIYGFTMEMRSNNSKFEIALKLIYIYFSLQRIRKPYGSQCWFEYSLKNL